MAVRLKKLGFTVMDEVTGEKATKSGIQHAIGELGNAADSTLDLVVIYYSGHGAIVKGGGRPMPSLVPQDAVPGEKNSFITDAELGTWLTNSLVTKQVVLILDSCYSAGIGSNREKRITEPVQISSQQVADRKRAIQQAQFVGAYFDTYVLLASSQAQETSKETEKGGLFTYYLLQGIGDDTGASCPACETGQNEVTVASLFRYAAQNVRAQVDQQPQIKDPGGQSKQLALMIPWITPRPRATFHPRPRPIPTPVATSMPPPAPRLPGNIPQEYFQFTRIPAGTFHMGSPASEANREADETQHEVTVSRFEMQTTLVTQGLWQAVMGSNPSHFKGADLPVDNVSWYDVQAFISKLNQKLGTNVYRLPTEAEWEYAARAGTTTRFWTGEKLTTDQANFNNSRGKTTPVKTFAPNPWGLYDMAGNLWEWVQDWYGNYPSGSVADPTGPSTGSRRVIRGGSWYDHAKVCRSAYRYGYDPGARDDGNLLGFRLSRS